MKVTQKSFGTHNGQQVTEYTIHNENGMQLSVINYGGYVTRVITPDKNNEFANVILCYRDISGYIANGNQYLGSLVGRYCNRIANGKFTLDGNEYTLARNNSGNSLHGGEVGFDKVFWTVQSGANESGLQLKYLSKDGEEGYPGNLDVTVTYTLTNDNSVIIDYTAVTDNATPVNLTNHCYFNLSGKKNTDTLNHEMQLFANEYTIVNETLVPTGEIATVKNTPLDFTNAKPIGRDIADIEGGYDHNFILEKRNDENLQKAAVVYDPDSGRKMEMFTTEPAVQFYSGNFLNGEEGEGEIGATPTYTKHAAFCLEAQHYPDSPNHSHFPNTILRPGETYRQTTEYKFLVDSR